MNTRFSGTKSSTVRIIEAPEEKLGCSNWTEVQFRGDDQADNFKSDLKLRT